MTTTLIIGVYVKPEFYRPIEVDLLIDDPTKSKSQIEWVHQYGLAGLVKGMVESGLSITV